MDAMRVAEILRELQEVDTATIYESAGREGMLPAGIRSIGPSPRIAGRAVTASCPAMDNLTLHVAVAAAGPGDVIVADAHGCMEAGHWGEILSIAAQARGIQGLILDGAVRDSASIAERGFTVFARGLCIGATTKSKLGPVHQPIVLGSTIVRSGDLVVGDADGCVVVPIERAEEILTLVRKRCTMEKRVIEQLQAGKTTLEILDLEEKVRDLERNLNAKGPSPKS